MKFICSVFLLLLVQKISADNSTTVEIEEEVPVTESSYPNRTLIKTGNELWDGILNECTESYKISCIQKNVYSYLSTNLDHKGDYRVIDEIVFKPNKVDYTKYTREANEINHEDSNDEDDLLEDSRSMKSPIEEVTEALYDKSVKFMMTHDLQLQMPDMMFDGATVKVQPRAIEGNGALVYIEMVPREIFEDEQQQQKIQKHNFESRGIKDMPKLFKKKIQQFFKNKLLTSFMALMLIVKLIKLLIMFVLPVIVGVGTAKKIILKVLLFLFPALAHLFKLCSYYHNDYHQTKYHHHHHQIAHVHHEPGGHIHYAAPAPSYGPPTHSAHYAASSHSPDFEIGPPFPGSELSRPPHLPHSGISLHHAPEIHVPGQKLFEHESDPLELSGPGLGPEFISHRNSDFIPGPNDENEIKSWGLSLDYPTTKLQPQASPSKKVVSYARPPSLTFTKQPASGVIPAKLTKSQIAELALKAEKEVLLKARLQQEKLRLQQENLRLQEQLKAQESMKIQNQLKLHEALKQQERLKLGEQQQQTSPKIVQHYQYTPQIPPIPPQYPTNQQYTSHQGQASINVPVVASPNAVSINRNPITQANVGTSKVVSVASPNSIQSGGAVQHQGIATSQNTKESVGTTNNVSTSKTGSGTTFTIQKSISSEYDPFYSPILEKIDAIFVKLGVHSEGCRERLICSMYKNPARFSPHSNLISAELSRDSKELQKPTTTNAPVIRFYRYVQAARDGQEKHDCLKTYAACSFATEK